jgi:hypothetical protein
MKLVLAIFFCVVAYEALSAYVITQTLGPIVTGTWSQLAAATGGH